MPELFSATALERVRARGRRERLAAVPYFAGLMAGDTDALVRSFAREPELHHPVRGRVRGVSAFERFVDETNEWIADRNVAVEDVDLIVTEPRTVEEVVLRLDGEAGRVELPVAIVADRESGGRLVELRLYFSTWPLTGHHAIRPPLLQADPDLHEADVVVYVHGPSGKLAIARIYDDSDPPLADA